MNSVPRSFGAPYAHIIYILSILGFFILSVFFYAPRSLTALMATGEGLYHMGDMVSFNLSICVAIFSVVLIITRLAFIFIRKYHGISMVLYISWCAMEVLMISFYTALYLTLMSQGGMGYFICLGNTFKDLATIFVYPCAIHTLAYCLSDERAAKEPDEGAKLRFYDSRNLLKFAVQASSILYLESNENYILINYLKEGTACEYKLRNSMRSVEQMCEKAGMVRSHRSFMVNPSHITLIRKDENGLYRAEFDSLKDKTVPVSKKFYDRVAAVL